MLNHSGIAESRLVFIAAICLGIMALIFQIFGGDVILAEPFHDGEFFASAVGLFSDSKYSLHPLAIHGAVDYIPALFAEYQWGAENYFLPTVVIYRVLSFLAAIFLVLVSYELSRNKSYQWLLLLAVATVSPILVGYKDLVLLISIYLFFKINYSDINRSSNIFLQILFGAVVAFGMFWSYDRGIAGALSLGAAVSILLFWNRWHAISLLSFVAVFLILGLFFEVFSFGNYLSDIYILMKTSSQWSYGWQQWPVVLTIFAIILNLTTISLLVVDHLNSELASERLPIVVLFVLLSIFMLKMGINRADVGHIHFTCWIPTLILLYLYEKYDFIRMMIGFLIGAVIISTFGLTIIAWSYEFFSIAAILIFAFLIIKSENSNRVAMVLSGFLIAGYLGMALYQGVRGFSGGQYSWIKSLFFHQATVYRRQMV